MRIHIKILAFFLAGILSVSTCAVSFAEDNATLEEQEFIDEFDETECQELATEQQIIEETECNEIEAGSTLKFDFGNNGIATGYTGVTATDAYSKSKGYGFSDINKVKNVSAGGAGALSDAVAFVSSAPFNVDLPTGVYKITVTTGDDYSTIIRAEGLPQILFMTGNNAVDSFTIPITDGQLNIYAATGVPGHDYSISTLEIEQVSTGTVTKPTIWLLGDSTVASYYNVSDDVRHGWGKYLCEYVDSNKYDVRNLSVSSINAKTLFSSFFSTVENYGKEGDICVITVGLDEYVAAYSQNQTTPDDTEYKTAITEMIRKAKAKGMKVYLVKQQGDYSDCVKYPLIEKRWFSDTIDAVADAEQVAVIDLFRIWLTYCLENNHRIAINYYTSNGHHLNLLGSRKLAEMMGEAIFAQPEVVQPAEPEDPSFNTASTITYQTEVSGEPIANPHKGYVITAYNPYMMSASFEYGRGGSANNAAWDIVTICNGVHYWNEVNPEEGVYDWKEIDDMLTACEAYGMTYIIRILPYSHLSGSHENYGAAHNKVPQWIFDKGAKKKRVTLVSDPSVEIDVPVWDDPIYLEACRDFATALAKHYDGDPRVEFIDVRPFGNWGEWHTSQFVGSDMPSVEIQKDMLKYYRDAFDKTLLAVPTGAWGEVYEYARSLGIAKRNDGMISSSNEEWDLCLSYKDNIPALAENASPYSMLLENENGPYGPLKWTETRFRECIEIPHLTITALDQDSHCGYEFYKEQKAVIDEMQNRIGYNFTVTSAKRNGNRLQIKIKNTGVAPCYFNIKLCAEVTDSKGNKIRDFGEPIMIEKGTFHDEDEKTFVFTYDGSIDANMNICLAMYDCDNSLVAGKNPTVKFDNKNNLSSNRLMLVEVEKDKLTGWQKIDGKWYYYNENGVAKKGWQSVGGKWYYLDATGVMVTGWRQVKGIWYYLESNGAMVTGWKQVKGIWYYFESSGAMVTGWKQVKGIWYYFKSSGAMVANEWLLYNDAWYYLESSGAMASNKTLTIGGKSYRFNDVGKWIK